MIDGEVVAFDGSQTSFARLAQRGQHYVPVFYYVFDVLWLEGHDVRKLPLRTRKRLLRDALAIPRERPLDAAPQPRRGGVLRRGVPQGLGRADRQARRQPVRDHALARLAQVQVRARPGAGDRRLHPAAWLAGRVRRAPARLLPRRRGSSTPARSGPGSTPRRSTRSARSCASSSGRNRRSPTRRRSRSEA